MVTRKAGEEFKAKATGRTRNYPPAWRRYRAGAKVRGMDIHVRVHAGQQERLVEKLNAILEDQRYLFPGTMQRYVFEEDAEPKNLIISLICKYTEMPDESATQHNLNPLQAELADVLDWDTAQYTTKQAIIHT